MIHIIISPHMHHQRTACQIRRFEARGEYRLTGVTFRIHEERGQITQMAFTPRSVMALRVARVVMAARGKRGNHLPIALLRVAARVLVQMESMHSRGEPFQ